MNTTILGILTIIGGVVNAALELITTGSCNFLILSAALTSGWGLVKAKDAKPTA